MTENPKTKRPGGAGMLYLRGKTWWTQVSVRGRTIRESTQTSDEKKAAKILRRRAGAIANGITPDALGTRYEHIRDAYLAESELDEKKALRRDKQGNRYLESVKRMDEFFARRRVVEIDGDLMRKFQVQMRAQGYANGSINRSLASLRAMFTLAQREEKIRNLPYFPMLKESKPRKGTLPGDKYEALRAALPDYVRPVVTIGYRTGMRLGEILGLTWANINFLDGIIRIEDSKNGEAREIPFSGELETVLREQFAKRQHGCDRVCFRINRLGHPVKIGNFRKPWRRACIAVGLGKMEPKFDRNTRQPLLEVPRYEHSKPKPKLVYTGLIFHDLRRTFVTDAEHAGAARHEVMTITGHRSEMIYKRYAIGNRKQRRAALDQIDQYRTERLSHNSDTISEIGIDSPNPETSMMQ